MKEIAIQYSYTYGFLQTILSAFLYILEEYISSTDTIVNNAIVQRSKKWNSTSENLSTWVFEVQTSLHKHVPVMTKDEALYIFSSMEDVGDDFTFLWCDKLDLAAKNFYERTNKISQGICLYYLYCGVTCKTLMESDEVITRITSDFPVLYHQHQEGKERLNKLIKLLNDELESIGEVTGLNEDDSKELWENIESVADDLIQDWHTAIVNAVQGLK